MRLYIRAVGIFVIALLLPAMASADDAGVCQAESNTVAVSAVLDACTRLIASGGYTGSDLAVIMRRRENAYTTGKIIRVPPQTTMRRSTSRGSPPLQSPPLVPHRDANAANPSYRTLRLNELVLASMFESYLCPDHQIGAGQN